MLPPRHPITASELTERYANQNSERIFGFILCLFFSAVKAATLHFALYCVFFIFFEGGGTVKPPLSKHSMFGVVLLVFPLVP